MVAVQSVEQEQLTAVPVRCKGPACHGQGKLLFKISADHRTIYAQCKDPRCHYLQAIDIDSLPTQLHN